MVKQVIVMFQSLKMTADHKSLQKQNHVVHVSNAIYSKLVAPSKSKTSFSSLTFAGSYLMCLHKSRKCYANELFYLLLLLHIVALHQSFVPLILVCPFQ